jgi:hypothetical protein
MEENMSILKLENQVDKESKKWTGHLGGGHLAILSLPQPKTYSTEIFSAINPVLEW